MREPRPPQKHPNRIRELREARGLTQHDLGKMLGTGNQQVSRLELGERRLTTDWMVKLSKALRVEPWELMAQSADSPQGPEARALELFRQIDDDRKGRVLELLEWLSRDTPKRD